MGNPPGLQGSCRLWIIHTGAETLLVAGGAVGVWTGLERVLSLQDEQDGMDLCRSWQSCESCLAREGYVVVDLLAEWEVP